MIFGQLGDDQIHGDGLLNGSGGKNIGVNVTSGTGAAILRATNNSSSPFYASRSVDLSDFGSLDLSGVVTGDLLTVGEETFFITGIDPVNSVLTVDRSIDTDNGGGDWQIDSNLKTLLLTIDGSDVGGDDYIEGNGGNDMVRGGFGQDDIIGGSSSIFSLKDPEERPDGSDVLFGGNGSLVARNNYGTAVVGDAGDPISTDLRHARDSDMILGDNGNIFRLVGINGEDSSIFLSFNYDNYSDAQKIVVRAAQLLDYTPGGFDYDASKADKDNGAADIIRGESGDDFIYGMVGSDILFGDAQDDDIIGGYGYDWISGGTGDDGVLGDDGRIYTSRNSATVDEPLYGIGIVTVDLEISTPGNIQVATINQDGALKKTANLAPFNLDKDNENPLFKPSNANDIIYGGLGSDFLHGGAGDDAISGAEALTEFYNNPQPQEDVLRWGEDRAGEFAAYDEYNPRLRIVVDDYGSSVDAVDGLPGDGIEFLLNFDHEDSGAPLDIEGLNKTDGDDRIFGDLGNDWLVGGTGRDHGYGGRGDDLINMDDNHDSNDKNDIPDTAYSYEDIAYGGAGRDIMIGNTGGDRLIDWAGEFNSYIVPFAPFGLFTISRSLQPQLMEYLYDLAEADGADQTLGSAFNDSSDPRNGEPNGELGLVKQQDPDWRDQTGAPDDPQPGNIPGGSRDVLRGATFSSGSGNPDGFSSDIGTWSVRQGELYVAPQTLGGDAVSVFYVDAIKPSYFEVSSRVNIDKPTAGYKANAYLMFDYQSDTDFKFAGIDDSTNKLVIGHFDGSEWVVDSELSTNIRFNTDYQLLLSINGLTATLLLDNTHFISFSFDPRTDPDTGFVFGLNDGMVGVGTNNARGYFDNVNVQVLPPEITFTSEEDFSDGQANLFIGQQTGGWQVNAERYEDDVLGGLATSFIDIGLANGLETASVLEATLDFSSDSLAGFLFDAYSPTDFKFAGLDVVDGFVSVVIGHHTNGSGLVIDASFATSLPAGSDHELGIVLKGTTVSLTLDGAPVLGHIFNSLVVDGAFGVMSFGSSSFDSVNFKTDDPAFIDGNPDNNQPVAGDDVASTDEDTILTIDVLANDSDPDSGDVLSITAVTQGSAGGIVTLSGGLVSYDPTTALNGLAFGETVTDTFGYTISDGQGGYTNATVSITISGVNDAPVAQEDSAATNEDESVIIDVLGNDSDPDAGDSLNISSVNQGVKGGLVTINGGSVSYDPNGQFDDLTLGESTTDTFSYTLSDSNGASVSVSVTVTINGVDAGNLAPVAEDDTFQTDEDTAIIITAADLLGNDNDPDAGDILTVDSITQPGKGSLSNNGDGTYTYTPDQDFNGSDNFTYTVSDGRGGSDTAQVTISILPVNDAPEGNPDSLDAVEGTPLTISIASLVSNDDDAEGSALSLISFTQPEHGTLERNTNGTLTYTPEAGFVGEDSFTYIAGDGDLLSDPVTVTIDVTPAIAGTYTYSMVGGPVAIPDNGFDTYQIEVTDSFTILDINVALDITHGRVNDLRVVLVSPDGIAIELFNRVGGRGNNFSGTVLDDSATTAIGDGAAPFSGVYLPTGNLSQLEGMDVQGTWTLEIYDVKRRNTGTLNSWSIEVTRGSTMVASASAPESSRVRIPSLTQAELDGVVEQVLLDWSQDGLINAEELASSQRCRGPHRRARWPRAWVSNLWSYYH